MKIIIEFPEAEFYFVKEQNLILLELINLSDEDFNFFVEKMAADVKKEIFFENGYIVLYFIDEYKKFALNVAETDIELMYNDGISIGFSFRKNENEVCEQVAVFSNKTIN